MSGQALQGNPQQGQYSAEQDAQNTSQALGQCYYAPAGPNAPQQGQAGYPQQYHRQIQQQGYYQGHYPQGYAHPQLQPYQSGQSSYVQPPYGGQSSYSAQPSYGGQQYSDYQAYPQSYAGSSGYSNPQGWPNQQQGLQLATWQIPTYEAPQGSQWPHQPQGQNPYYQSQPQQPPGHLMAGPQIVKITGIPKYKSKQPLEEVTADTLREWAKSKLCPKYSTELIDSLMFANNYGPLTAYLYMPIAAEAFDVSRILRGQEFEGSPIEATAIRRPTLDQ